jgi:hypothetical protein
LVPACNPSHQGSECRKITVRGHLFLGTPILPKKLKDKTNKQTLFILLLVKEARNGSTHLQFQPLGRLRKKGHEYKVILANTVRCNTTIKFNLIQRNKRHTSWAYM